MLLFSFGLIEGITHNMRNSLLALIAFFAVGFLLLLATSAVQKTKLVIS